MTENNITNLFEDESPKILITPSKRRQSESFDEHSAKLKTHQICLKNSRVLVQDTPTPFMGRKQKIIENDVQPKNSQKPYTSSITITRNIIPNTPVTNKNNASLINRKVKKLFDNNLLLLEEEELPGQEDTSNKLKKPDSNKKASSLFKPKAKLNGTGNESNLGYDLSSESMEKRSKRRKNPLVARLSEIEQPPNKLNESDDTSPVIVKTKKSQDVESNKTPKYDDLKSPYFTGRTPVSFCSKLTTFNNLTSFTHITEMNFDPTKRNDQFDNSNLCQETIHEKTEVDHTDNKTDTCKTTSEFNDSEIDQILFDGLSLEDNLGKSKSSKSNSKFGLVDSTNTTNTFKHKSSRSSSVISKSLSKKSDKSRSLSAYTKPEIYFPTKVKNFNLTHLELDEDQTSKMKKVIKNLNQEYKKRNEIIQSTYLTNFSSTTTHLIIDFEKKFNGNTRTLNTNSKFLLLLASLKECKLIRYEWLLHSDIKKKWCSHNDYLLESYIGDLEELDEDEQNEFDIKLIKFNRNLKLTDRIDLFSKLGNIFILNNNENSSNESMNETQNSFSDSFTFFKSKDKIQDYLYEIITKCNGLITSRVACADIIIAIDKGDDYDPKTEYGQQLLAREAIRFKKSFKDVKNKLVKCKLKKKISVLSSNWVIDCILENGIKNKDDYEMRVIDGIEEKEN